MPCGLIWLVLMALVLLAWRRKQRAMLASLLVLLGFYTVAGNDELSKLPLMWLEHDYAAIDPFAETPCDAVLVLGGGVDVAANGQSQLSLAGDRPALAVRLFHA